MYLIESMIDMGLKRNSKWPTVHHRAVAIELLIGNPEVTTMDSLQTGVSNIVKIPNYKIKQVTLEELKDFGFEITTRITPINRD